MNPAPASPSLPRKPPQAGKRFQFLLVFILALCPASYGDSPPNPATETPHPHASEPRSEFLLLFDSLERLEKSITASDAPQIQKDLADFSQRLKSETIHLEFRWVAATAAVRLCYSFGELAVCEQAIQTFSGLLPGWDQSAETQELFFCIALFGNADRSAARDLLWKLLEQSPELEEAQETRAWERWIYALGYAGHDLIRVRNLDLKGTPPRGFFSIRN